MEIQSFQTSATRIKANSHLPLQLTRVSTSEPITDSPGAPTVWTVGHKRHSEPQSHPGWSCPSQDPGCCETTHCLPVSDSLSQDSLGLAVDFLPAAGGFRERPHPSLPTSTGTGKAENTRGLEGSGWAFPCSWHELTHFSVYCMRKVLR